MRFSPEAERLYVSRSLSWMTSSFQYSIRFIHHLPMYSRILVSWPHVCTCVLYSVLLPRLLQMGPALGGYLLATVLTGKLYDQVARRHGDSLFCIGADCYMMTWAVLGGLNLVVLLGTIEMYGMSVGRYRRIVRGGGV